MKRFAAIDVGSNALRMQIVEAKWTPRSRKNALGAWSEIARCRSAVRLGHDAFLGKWLTEAVMDSACQTLKDFRRAMDAARIDGYRAVATSALREAKNGQTLVARVRETTGIRLEIIDGKEEAELVAHAVARRIPLLDGRVVLFDLGGGSAEITLLEHGLIRSSRSLPLGTVRLLRDSDLLREGRLDASAQSRICAHIDRVLLPALGSAFGQSSCRVIVTGGNAKALAQLCPANDGASDRVDVRKMNELYLRLAPLSPAERSAVFSLRPDRADVVVPAAAVLLRLARHLEVGTLLAPRIGLRDGILDALIAESPTRDLHPTMGTAARFPTRALAVGRTAASIPS